MLYSRCWDINAREPPFLDLLPHLSCNESPPPRVRPVLRNGLLAAITLPPPYPLSLIPSPFLPFTPQSTHTNAFLTNLNLNLLCLVNLIFCRIGKCHLRHAVSKFQHQSAIFWAMSLQKRNCYSNYIFWFILLDYRKEALDKPSWVIYILHTF